MEGTPDKPRGEFVGASLPDINEAVPTETSARTDSTAKLGISLDTEWTCHGWLFLAESP